MALTAPFPFCDAIVSRNLSALKNTPGQNVQMTFSSSLNTAMSSGLYTCNFSVGSIPDIIVQSFINTLEQLGYGISKNGLNYTVTW